LNVDLIKIYLKTLVNHFRSKHNGSLIDIPAHTVCQIILTNNNWQQSATRFFLKTSHRRIVNGHGASTVEDHICYHRTPNWWNV